jgi:thioesterase domain-containing protein
MKVSEVNVLEAQTRHVRDAIPLFDAMQLTVVGLAPGTAAVQAPQEPNRNHAGMMYAGSLFSLAEVLGGLLPPATWDITGYVPIVADVRIRFRAPAMGTIRATAELPADEIARVGQELAAGAAKVWFTLEAVLTDSAGVTVASTEGKYVLMQMTVPGSANG